MAPQSVRFSRPLASPGAQRVMPRTLPPPAGRQRGLGLPVTAGDGGRTLPRRPSLPVATNDQGNRGEATWADQSSGSSVGMTMEPGGQMAQP